ncbi:hypothetical protein BDY21DRAFT_329543 [Lineolata rhizophorae]|uniref:Protein kinase domain-containing protein n=1 Tax=Lineolata rhizophorae TaxID=578093 RepID=A0A6A6PDD1_9PEZI|nr:hypothetical protein BDY21DRAFT_329543 [Lineolata rhizophorae]
MGKIVRRRMMSSELDLHHFERSTVHDQISLIVSQLHEKDELRKAFRLEGSVQFENHSNTLSQDADIEEGMQSMSEPGPRRRRSPRLLEQERQSGSQRASAIPASAVVSAQQTKSARPRADQFCVYNISSDSQRAGSRIPAFVIEYKAPHKLTLGHIYEGLEEMDLAEVVRSKDTDGPKEHCRRLVAAAITQAFSYMVRAGLEFGCVCNGEASIFLRIPEDPRTVLFFLSVPKGDMWATPLGGRRMATRTIGCISLQLGKMLAFTLQSLKKPPRSHSWRDRAFEQLKIWKVIYHDLLKAIPADEAPSSEYRPPRQEAFFRASPIRLRPRRHVLSAQSCSSYDRLGRRETDEDGSDPETPSRPPRSAPSRATRPFEGSGSSTERLTSGSSTGQQYCTQECLRSLVDGRPLDKSCPNVNEHGREHHQIDGLMFCALIRQQLAQDLDSNFEPIGRHRSRGVPFMVRLASHGYTLVAKCSPIDFVPHMMHEAIVYDRLRPIQGIHVPVYLGSIHLVRPYYYDAIAYLTHAMFLSFGGMPIHKQISTANCAQVTDQAVVCIRAIHNLQVLHRDLKPRNVVRDPVTGRVMILDFERAEERVPRPVLGTIAPNRKMRRDESGLIKARDKSADLFSRERRSITAELSTLAV